MLVQFLSVCLLPVFVTDGRKITVGYMADRLTPNVTDGHTHGWKKLELMTTDSLNAYDFIQFDKG